MMSPFLGGASAATSSKARPIFNLSNIIWALLGFSVTYTVVAYFHIGANLHGSEIEFIDSAGPQKQKGGINVQHAHLQDRLQTAIDELEREHKHLQELVLESETLLQERKKKNKGGGDKVLSHIIKEVATGRGEKMASKAVTTPNLEALRKTSAVPAPITKPAVISVVPVMSSGNKAKHAPAIEVQSSKHTFVLDSTVPEDAEGRTSREPRAMMVVCGTDGSGTRSVVQTLTKLGVLMTSEDPETYDIHGDLMGGWPPMVKPVLSNTHSLNYDPKKIDPAVHKKVSSGLRRLIEQAERDSHKPESHKLAVGGALPRKQGTDATRVQYGFKAPVAMTLAPYWAHLTSHFKLLHVVRDGRDIAFSANQGPVQKFYFDMYGGPDPKDKEKLQRKDLKIKAMQLWSDWNVQLRQWSVQQAARLRSSGSGGDPDAKTFSYMSLHTEDLVSDDLQVRYRAISELAQWVGSTVTQEHICCLAQMEASFMGSHDRTKVKNLRNQAQEVSRRYGKWHSLVGRNQGLFDGLHRVGGDALQLFQYPVEVVGAFPTNPEAVPAEAINGHLCEATPAFQASCKNSM